MSSAETYDPGTGRFTATDPLNDSRFKLPHQAVQVSSGKLLIAGGSKASITLFHDVLGVRSAAHEIAHPTDPVTKKPDPTFDKAAVAAKL